MSRARVGCALLLTVSLAGSSARAQQAAGEAETRGDADEDASSGEERPAESSQADPPPREIVKDWNQYDLGPLTFKWGIYGIIDWGTAFQTAAATRQIDVSSDVRPRDFRFTFSGKFDVERPVTYSMGLMYDGPTNSWFPRETGIQVGFPELLGSVFVGRQKEGVSLNKITVGYAVWTMERMPINEATVPIMNDGIKWLGGLPSRRANWNFAVFRNVLPKNPATGWYETAATARIAWLPMLPEKEGALLHLAAGYHWGDYADGEAQLRSKPESSTAPFFLDTGLFPASVNHMLVLEAYLRRGSLLYGTEYFLNQVVSSETGDPFFHGGEVFVSWLLTEEVRPYIDLGGKLGFVDPDWSAFEHGPGAVETVLHLSYSDFDDGPVRGGRFWRLTPQVNWYIDSMVRISLNYGLGILDRFGTTQAHHFVQSRLQLQIQ